MPRIHDKLKNFQRASQKICATVDADYQVHVGNVALGMKDLGPFCIVLYARTNCFVADGGVREECALHSFLPGQHKFHLY